MDGAYREQHDILVGGPRRETNVFYWHVVTIALTFSAPLQRLQMKFGKSCHRMCSVLIYPYHWGSCNHCLSTAWLLLWEQLFPLYNVIDLELHINTQVSACDSWTGRQYHPSLFWVSYIKTAYLLFTWDRKQQSTACFACVQKVSLQFLWE